MTSLSDLMLQQIAESRRMEKALPKGGAYLHLTFQRRRDLAKAIRGHFHVIEGGLS